MNIKVKVSERIENIPQVKYQKIKRAVNMLIANDFDVEIIWGEPAKVINKAELYLS